MFELQEIDAGLMDMQKSIIKSKLIKITLKKEKYLKKML